MIELSFAKMNGAGNDFVVINNFDGSLNVDLPPLAAALCSKGFGVGADGLLVLKKSGAADFEMVYLNSDGSEGGMCGNGGRCIARFAVLNGICGPLMRFAAHGQFYSAEVKDETNVRLHFPDPDEIRASMKVPVDSITLDATYVHPNTDHTVFAGGQGFEDVRSADLVAFARKIRFNKNIFPRGTNVDLIEKSGNNAIRMRTYERGVENETLACGTGAVACAIASALRYGMTSPVNIESAGGETLKVHFERTGDRFSKLVLEGSAVIVFRSKVLYDERQHKLADYGQGKV